MGFEVGRGYEGDRDERERESVCVCLVGLAGVVDYVYTQGFLRRERCNFFFSFSLCFLTK